MVRSVKAFAFAVIFILCPARPLDARHSLTYVPRLLPHGRRPCVLTVPARLLLPVDTLHCCKSRADGDDHCHRQPPADRLLFPLSAVCRPVSLSPEVRSLDLLPLSPLPPCPRRPRLLPLRDPQGIDALLEHTLLLFGLWLQTHVLHHFRHRRGRFVVARRYAHLFLHVEGDRRPHRINGVDAAIHGRAKGHKMVGSCVKRKPASYIVGNVCGCSDEPAHEQRQQSCRMTHVWVPAHPRTLRCTTVTPRRSRGPTIKAKPVDYRSIVCQPSSLGPSLGSSAPGLDVPSIKLGRGRHNHETRK